MKIYNNYSGKLEKFKPFDKNSVKIYVCGITPYEMTHLGHAFTYVFYDTLIRYLRYKKYEVNYTQNVTDVDDDIIKKAKEQDQDWKELGNFWTERFLEDMKFLNVTMPTHFVKATNSIPKIIAINKDLIEKGFGYAVNGNVYFEVSKFKNYGKLSKFSRPEMIKWSKIRGADPKDPNKHDPLDFIMWQKSKADEPYWQSPWGNGRPGWHMECSAMINEFLGTRIDIHGGGMDLIYPHHESEIAQSESFTGRSPYVKYFAEVAMVYFEGSVMSKTLGNIVMVVDLSKKYSSNAIRFMLLSQYYRKEWEFTEAKMSEASEKMMKIEKALNQDLEEAQDKNYLSTFEKFMDNDIDIPSALDLIYKTSEEILGGKIKSNKIQSQCKDFFKILGFKI